MPQITKKDFKKLALNSSGLFANAAAIYLAALAVSHDHDNIASAEVTANIMGITLLSRVLEYACTNLTKKYHLDFSSYQSAYANDKKKLGAMIGFDIAELILKFGISLGVSACFSRDFQKLFDLTILFASKNVAERISLRTLNTDPAANNRFMSYLIGTIATYLGGDSFLALKNNLSHSTNPPYTKAIMAGQLVETLISAKLVHARERTLTIDQPYTTTPPTLSATPSFWNKVTAFFNCNQVNPETKPLQGP